MMQVGLCFVKKSRWNWLLISLFSGKLSILNCFTRVTLFWFILHCIGGLLDTFGASLRERRNQWKCWSRVLQACKLAQSDILLVYLGPCQKYLIDLLYYYVPNIDIAESWNFQFFYFFIFFLFFLGWISKPVI